MNGGDRRLFIVLDQIKALYVRNAFLTDALDDRVRQGGGVAVGRGKHDGRARIFVFLSAGKLLIDGDVFIDILAQHRPMPVADEF